VFSEMAESLHKPTQKAIVSPRQEKLQHAATCCNMLQHAATCCITPAQKAIASPRQEPAPNAARAQTIAPPFSGTMVPSSADMSAMGALHKNAATTIPACVCAMTRWDMTDGT